MILFSEILLVLGTILMLIVAYMSSLTYGLFWSGVAMIVWGIILIYAMSKKGGDDR